MNLQFLTISYDFRRKLPDNNENLRPEILSTIHNGQLEEKYEERANESMWWLKYLKSWRRIF